MKYIIALILFSACGQVAAQKKSSPDSLLKSAKDEPISAYGTRGGISFIGYMEGKTQVGHDPQGNLIVKGDSAAAIKLLFKMIDAGAKRESDHWRYIAQYEKQLATIRQMLNELKKANTVKK